LEVYMMVRDTGHKSQQRCHNCSIQKCVLSSGNNYTQRV